MAKKYKVILCANADFAKPENVGYRLYMIAKLLDKKKKLEKVIVRKSNKNNISKNKIQTIFPFYRSITLALKVINQVLPKYDSIYYLKPRLFDFFASKKLEKVEIIHLWSFREKLLENSKKKGAFIIADLQQGIDTSFNIDNIDYFIAPSKFVENDILKKTNINKNQIFTVPFGVDLEKYKIKDYKKNPNNKNLIFLFIGNYEKRKGLNYLIKAWVSLNLKNAELHIYGRKDINYLQLKKSISKKSKNLYLHGLIKSEEKKIRIYQEADVFIFPSLWEGSAKVTYEAMACSLPIITTPNAGSVIRDKKDGFLIRPENVSDIKEKILYFYKNPKKIEEMGKSGRKNVENYSWENYANNIYSIYEKIISKK
jgi:glycosyltransferase involved in cell wall biosynthesis